MSVQQLITPKNIVYGRGSLDELGKTAARLGKQALIVSDPVMERLGLVERCERLLQAEAIRCVKYTGIGTEPTDLYVREALEICKQAQCDIIVAVGGGSCIDTAKAVGILATNDGSLHDYMPGKRRFEHGSIPVVAVPTTAGTGSEATKVTVITDTSTEVKLMIADPLLMPAVALVDPLLTLSCPPAVTAATGVDALCHAIEAYISRKSQPVTDMYALKAIDLISRNLTDAYANGQQVEARDAVALGSLLAGMAFSNASVALVHGMSRPIGALFHVPHGLSNAMLLPAVLEYSKQECTEKLIRIGRVLDERLESPEDTVGWIKRLCRQLQIVNMKQWGITPDVLELRLDKMAADALASGSPANNPRIPTHREIVELYRTAYDYHF
ncbi:iron-containing alcohol dehydrogenase [Paenibacillus thalictri]|uniref:Iron-containing alcohol dehydrogenase n=1 Tax=Paenibacillus thalictri TaxID=2527873 RepID=A0A4V2J3Y6_9BACL|nr:iron-containing alcohol dehydrogenase [Paenibacillus thalictri]TBL76360.1 iron-containing alcohol dehydrogenase [Paenibacillus thalictri]